MNEHGCIRALVLLEAQTSRRSVLDKFAYLGDRVTVIAVVSGFYDALSLLTDSKPDLLVVDSGKEEVGPKLARLVKKRWPEVWVILFFTPGNRRQLVSDADFMLPLWSDIQVFLDSFDQIARTVALRRRILSAYTQPPVSQPDSVEQSIRRFIEENYHLPLSVHLLAERFNYAPSTIGRIFRDAFGISPMQYQIQLRIKRAKELLLSGQAMEVRQVADAVGYSDARYFSRIFRMKTGYTPTEWVDRHTWRTV